MLEKRFHGLLPQILERRTVRSFVCDEGVTSEHIQLLLEAACRAPSSSNAQPWRFWYAYHSSPVWLQLLELLAPSNAAWAKEAEWLMLVGAASKKLSRGSVVPNRDARFDVGAACQNLALQATYMGIGVAVVSGFDHAKAAALIQDEDIEPTVMIIVGAKTHNLALQPSSRRLVDEVAKTSFSER